MYTHTLTRLVLRGPGTHLDTLVREAIRVARAGARKGICAVGAHDYLLKTAPHRMFLRCDACGHETPGWYLNAMTSESRRNTGAGERQMNTSPFSKPGGSRATGRTLMT